MPIIENVEMKCNYADGVCTVKPDRLNMHVFVAYGCDIFVLANVSEAMRNILKPSCT